VIGEVLAAARAHASGPCAVLLADQNATSVLLKADRTYALRGGRIAATGAGAPPGALAQTSFTGERS
jgi:ABC-type branched-subunit amino acid transport system ATPase component